MAAGFSQSIVPSDQDGILKFFKNSFASLCHILLDTPASLDLVWEGPGQENES